MAPGESTSSAQQGILSEWSRVGVDTAGLHARPNRSWPHGPTATSLAEAVTPRRVSREVLAGRLVPLDEY
jgi:hypothetical protein